jgi:hypothetical protein
MPCCALAAFIIGQIVIGFDAFKRFVLGRPIGQEEIKNNPASEWLLFGGSGAAEVSAPALRIKMPIRWIAVAAALEIVLAMGAVYGVRTHRGHMNDASRAAAECRRGAIWQSR